MTRIDEIFSAAKEIYFLKGQSVFSRNDIKKQLGLDTITWEMGYTSGFQGMVENCPPLRNKINKKYQRVFKRISKGQYVFTEYGLSLLNE